MFSQLTIIGYLGKAPEMRFTPAGQAVTSFPVATSNSYTNSAGQKVDETTWFRVSVWGAQAESCKQYLDKGRPVLVVGRLNPDKETGGPRLWKGDDGVSHANFEVTAQTVRFLPSGKGEAVQQEEFTDDGLPF